MLAALVDYIESLEPEAIRDSRKEELRPVIAYIRTVLRKGQRVHLNFICTHNSRRSQFSQVWAQVFASVHGVDAQCYSGGVEVTAFNERAVASLRRAGFEITQEGVDNPRYTLHYSAHAAPILAFSKLFDDPSGPKAEFAAIMTCAHADENCPYIPGAEARIPMRFEDPKAYDDTPIEAEMYDASARLIATEMQYVFEQACHD